MSWRPKWPVEADVKLTIRCTREQQTKWHQEASACGHRHVETFIVAGADFLAWWWKRERELQAELEAHMRREAHERPEMQPCEPQE